MPLFSQIIRSGTALGQTELDNQARMERQIHQQEFDYMMNSTQYQRSIVDMQQAGMNPIYAAQGGYTSNTTQTSATRPEIPYRLKIKMLQRAGKGKT